MMKGWPSFASMKLSKATPTMPAGMVLMSRQPGQLLLFGADAAPPDAAKERGQDASHLAIHKDEHGQEGTQMKRDVESFV